MGQGLRRPKNPKLGADITGEVEAVGSRVEEFNRPCCPAIDWHYPLSETAEALRYLGTGQPRAKDVNPLG
jgi:hypothetical protein